MAFQDYRVFHAFYVADLSSEKIKEGEMISFDSTTFEAKYKGTVAVVPQMATAIKQGWVLDAQSAKKAVVVTPHTQRQATNYPVASEQTPVSRLGGRGDVDVRPEDMKPVSQVRLFSSANAGSIDLSKGGAGELQQQHRQAEAERIRLAAQNSALPQVRYTEGITLTTSTGNRANRTEAGSTIWDGGSESDVVGRVGETQTRKVQASAPVVEDYDEDYDDYEDEVDEDLEFDEAALQEKMNIILAALPEAYSGDIRLKLAILRALIPGFPQWDHRAHWKKKLKAFHETIEINPNFIGALKLVESDAFWKHIR